MTLAKPTVGKLSLGLARLLSDYFTEMYAVHPTQLSSLVGIGHGL